MLDYFARHDLPVRVDDGALIVPGGPEDAVYGLANLSQRCAQIPEPGWPAAIADHFDTLRAAMAETPAVDARLRDPAAVRPLLRARLYPPESVPDPGACFTRTDLPGLLTTLVVDLPTSIRTLGVADTRGWGQDSDALFAIALANQRALAPPTAETMDLGDGLTLYAYEDQHFFVATEALTLDRLPATRGRFGTLLAVPIRTVLLALPVDDNRVLRAIGKLAQLVPRMAAEGPGTVSGDLYWRCDDRFHRIGVTTTGDEVGVTPPPAVLELLSRLPAPATDNASPPSAASTPR